LFREPDITYLLITHIYVQVDYQLSIVVDYSYYQLLSIVNLYVYMCDILLCKTVVAKKAWVIAGVIFQLDHGSVRVNEKLS